MNASGPADGRHIVLVGLPGAGKTTVGRALAERLGRPFLDFDEEIVRREGATVADLFEQRGEAYFRARERALTEELAAVRGMVLAPGGGWVTNQDVVALLRAAASIIYLRVTPETALDRLGEGRRSRPLLRQADPLAALRALLVEREPLYRTADHVVDVDRVDVQQLVERVARLVRGD